VSALIMLGLAQGNLHSTPAVTASGRFHTGIAEVPVARELLYTVDARVRPLLFFWIGRDNVGSARITWRKGTAGERAFDLLIGSDPERAPRRINRWGFITERLSGDDAEVLGIMKESGEQTLEEAEASVGRQTDGMAVFKTSRSTITKNVAIGGTADLRAPARLTYRELDDVLSLVPDTLRKVRTLELPPGTHRGFLVALDTMIGHSIEPCRARVATSPATVSYVYDQTLYTLSLESCDFEPRMPSRVGVFTDVVNSRFEVRNRSTGNETSFRVVYGTSGDHRGVPVRALFRPHWWIEVELLLDSTATRHADGVADAAGGNRP
jgi:hypothetical protein